MTTVTTRLLGVVFASVSCCFLVVICWLACGCLFCRRSVFGLLFQPTLLFFLFLLVFLLPFCYATGVVSQRQRRCWQRVPPSWPATRPATQTGRAQSVETSTLHAGTGAGPATHHALVGPATAGTGGTAGTATGGSIGSHGSSGSMLPRRATGRVAAEKSTMPSGLSAGSAAQPSLSWLVAACLGWLFWCQIGSCCSRSTRLLIPTGSPDPFCDGLFVYDCRRVAAVLVLSGQRVLVRCVSQSHLWCSSAQVCFVSCQKCKLTRW